MLDIFFQNTIAAQLANNMLCLEHELETHTLLTMGGATEVVRVWPLMASVLTVFIHYLNPISASKDVHS